MRVETIGDATRTTAIYALCEYPSWTPRYVGKTVQYLHQRHQAHILDAKRGRRLPVHYWLRKQIAADTLAIKLLEYVQPGADWAARERAWIAKLKADGHSLLNLTAGGEGLPGHRFSEEHRQKIAAALRTGAHCNCLQCGASFWRKANQIARGHNKFCSRTCSNTYTQGGHRGAA